MKDYKGQDVHKLGKCLHSKCSLCPVSALTEWTNLNDASNNILQSTRQTSTYQPGSTIFHQNDAPLGVYCLMNGLVILKQMDVHGIETAFRLLFPGQTCGWRSLFGEHPHQASALVLEASTVCFIPLNDIENMLLEDPSLSRRFLKTIARDPGPANAVVLRNPPLAVRTRLTHLLLILSEQCMSKSIDGDLCYHLPIQRKHIASLIGTSVETVSRTIKELEDDSVVFFDRKKVLIPSIEKLRREVE